MFDACNHKFIKEKISSRDIRKLQQNIARLDLKEQENQLHKMFFGNIVKKTKKYIMIKSANV